MPCLHRPAPRPCATATRSSPRSPSTATSSTAARRPGQRQPGRLNLDVYRPTGDTQTKRRRSCVRPRRRLTGGDKNSFPATRLREHLREARLRGGLDQLPPDRERMQRGRRRGFPLLARSRPSTPNTTGRRRCAGCAPTPPPTGSTRRASRSLASRPAGSRRRWSGRGPTTRADSGNPGPSSAVGAFTSISGGAPGGRPSPARRRPRDPVSDGTADPVVPLPVVRPDRQRPGPGAGSPAGSSCRGVRPRSLRHVQEPVPHPVGVFPLRLPRPRPRGGSAGSRGAGIRRSGWRR